MIHSIAGLNVDQVGLVVHALSQAGNRDLASLYITTLALIDNTLILLLKEMFSTRQHILYWSQLAKSSHWELFFYKLNSHMFKAIFSRVERDYLILDDSEVMLRHADMLRSDLNDLSILLEKVFLAGSHLKAIYVQLASMGGSVSDTRRRQAMGITTDDAKNKSELELENLDKSESIHQIGVKLGLSMNTPEEATEGEETEAMGLAIASEDDEFVAGEQGIDELRERQKIRFQNKQEGREEELRIIREVARGRLEQSLLILTDCFAQFLPHLVVKTTAVMGNSMFVNARLAQGEESRDRSSIAAVAARSLLNPSGKRCNLNIGELEDVFCQMEAFIAHLRESRGRKEFPLQFTQARVHKPSERERFWFRRTLLVAGCALSVHTAVDLVRDGTIAKLYALFLSKLHNHVIDPVNKLALELFDTIRKREFVVTREECEESRDALHRMLYDFSRTDKGSSLISDMKDRIKEGLREQQEAASAMASRIRGGGGGSSGGSGVGATTSVAGEASSALSAASRSQRAAAVLVAPEFSPEQAMAALMTAYEKELQAPVKGVVFGNLMTAILIQMQKLKVHTEAAMLTMDQILASNELTIAATAAMPAFGFIGVLLLSLRKWLQPRASKPGLATTHLRLIMADVERSLQELLEINRRSNSSPRSCVDGDRRTQMSLELGQSTDTISIPPSSPSHSVPQSAAPQTPRLSRGRSTSMASFDHADKDTRALERYQRSLRTRSLAIAQGTLRFNLLRLRNEFQDLFGHSKGRSTVVAVGQQARALSMAPSSGRRSTLGLGKLGFVGGFGMESMLDSDSGMAMTLRKWRISRATFSTPATSLTATTTEESTGNRTDSAVDKNRAELIAQMLAIMQRDERCDRHRHDSRGPIGVVLSFVELLQAVYAILFGSGEELTATTQYSSLSRDIGLLESPEFEVGLERKISTAARMRTTYSCLMPSNK